MKLPHPVLILSLLLAPAVALALESPADYAYEPPLRGATLSGSMLSDDAEYLTPIGIVDELPMATVEPAAGPAEDPSATAPAL